MLNELSSIFIRLRSSPPSLTPALTFVPPSPPSLIEKFIPSSHSLVLLNLSSQFNTCTFLEFYTDGSLVNLGSPSIRMGLAWLQTAPCSPMISYATALTSSFPSSSVAELMAVFTAVIVAPKQCRVNIFTDSQVVISQYNNYKRLLLYSPSKRPFLKIANVYLWHCFFHIIATSALTITLIKVKAHAGDHYNENADKLAKASLDTPALYLNIVDDVHTTLYYHGLAIASPIRPFIKNITRAEMLAKFINLDINTKYNHLNIDWIATAFCISDNISNTTTDYISSVLKRKKIQRLLEMMPTMNVLIKRHPLLFDNTSLCCRCHLESEDFNHIWTCPLIIHKTHSIITSSKEYLLELLDINDISTVNQLHLWSLSDDSNFSFVNLIKGIVPRCLSNMIYSLVSPRTNANSVLSNFMHSIFEKSQEIWKERCTLHKEFEHAHDITDQLKRSLTDDSGYHFPTSLHYADSSNLINNMIRLGSHWSNFWCSRGQALFRF